MFARIAALVLSVTAIPAFAADPPEWTQPTKPFRIAPGITYIGTKGLSAYLIETSAGAILLEGTMPANAALIEHNIESQGVPLHQVKILISDHAHIDHVGALAKIKQDTGAKLLASAQDRWALEHGIPRGDTDYGVWKFPPVAVDGVVGDGQQIRLGNTVLTAHLIPGHTPGCTTWTMTVIEHGRPLTVMFLGSISVAGNLLTGNRAYPGIVTDFRARLSSIRPSWGKSSPKPDRTSKPNSPRPTNRPTKKTSPLGRGVHGYAAGCAASFAASASAAVSTRKTLPDQILAISALLYPAFSSISVTLGRLATSSMPTTPPPPSQSAPIPT
jgi:metallo-beta-lactamase class B